MNVKTEKHPKERYIPRSWDEISDELYRRIEWYASKFITISVAGVVIGVIGIVYGIVSLVLVIGALSVFLGLFVGLGALVASLVLLVWGVFWRRRVESKKIL
jgi:hypothetical protein